MSFSEFRRLLSLLVLLTGCLRAQLLIYQDTLFFSPPDWVDTLRAIPVIQNSWELYDQDGNLFDTSLVSVDPLTGIVGWIAPVEKPLSVTMRYAVPEGLTTIVLGPAWQYLPSLEQQLSGSAVAAPATRVSGSPPASGPSGSDQLVTSGSLFRSLSLTSGSGVNLGGGLDLQLQGELAQGVFINGSLTDQNLPILPEGDTRTLNELDQIRLAVNSRWGGIEVGDFILQSQGGQFSSFERKLEGMLVRLQGEHWRAEGSLAGSPGRFRSQQIQGQDGRQGPYGLTTHEGSRRLIILPGTEAVWLNGERMQRGESLDYTIDYTTGELSFTPLHTIRSDSRIVVDFEYTDLVYNRTTSYLSTSWTGERSSFTVTAFNEQDNLQSNLEFSLSEQDQEYLQEIGDRDQEAAINTAVPDTVGNYDLVDGHYVWSGLAQGEYTVTFHNIGSRGEYRRVVEGNRVIYRWVPPEERDQYNAVYAPFRMLKLPQQRNLLLANWRLWSESEGRLAQVELGVSDVDLNRYSPLDDQDNRDAGYAMQLRWVQPMSLAGHAVRAGMQLDGLGKGSGFQPPGRWDVVELERDWDLDGQPGEYHWQALNLFLEEGANRRIYTELGHMDADSATTRRLRWGLVGNVGVPLMGRFNQTLLYREDEQRWWRLADGELRYQVGSLEPFLRYYGEDRHKASLSGYRVEQYMLGFQARISEDTQIELGRERRLDVFQAGTSETAYLWRLSLLRSAPGGNRLETTVSYNEKTASDDRDDLSYLMGNLALVHRPLNRPWWLDLRYRLERSVAESKIAVYDSVGVGLGQYRYDQAYDTYVQDDAGEFRRYVIPAGEIRPVNSVIARLRFQVDLNRARLPLDLAGGFHEARLILQGRLAAVTEKRGFAAYYNPALDDTAVVSAESRLQLDIALQSQPQRPQYKLRILRLVALKREDGGQTGAATAYGETLEQSSVDLGRVSRHLVNGRTVNLELNLACDHKSLQSLVSALRQHDIIKWQGKGTISGAIGDQFTASLSGNWRQEQDRDLNDLQVNTFISGTGLQRTIGSSGRLRADLEWVYVTVSRDVAIPYLLAEGFPAGWSQRAKASGQLYLSSNLLLTVTLFSRREAGRAPFTNATLELRTQF